MWNIKPEPFAPAGRLAALVAVLAVCLPALAWADELAARLGADQTPVMTAFTSTPPPATPCVLLRNDNVLFGAARQVGQFVVIKTGEGGEIKLNRQEVLCWADSLRNLYRYRVDHRQRGDLSALARDARWCLRYDLHDLVAQEIRQMRAMDPDNAEADKIEDQLRRQVVWQEIPVQEIPVQEIPVQEIPVQEIPVQEIPVQEIPVQPDPANKTASAAIRIVGYEDPGLPEQNELDIDSDETPVAVNAQTLHRFASHIQPMLSNRCGRCHEAGKRKVDGWTLVVPTAGSRASSRMTRDNLSSVLTQIDTATPDQSPLLVKATTAHGGEEAPLDARNAKAIELLKLWLWMAASSMLESSDQVSSSVPSSAATGELVAGTARTLEPTDLASTGSEPARPAEIADLNLDAMPSGPSRLPQVANPFDPDLFNRRFALEANDAD